MDLLKNDSYLLLSIVNMKLRDYYEDLSKLCEDLDLDKNQLIQKLADINYVYNEKTNQFVKK